MLLQQTVVGVWVWRFLTVVAIASLPIASVQAAEILPTAPDRDYLLSNPAADPVVYFRKSSNIATGAWVVGIAQRTPIGVCFRGELSGKQIIQPLVLASGYPSQVYSSPIELSDLKQYPGNVGPTFAELLQECIQQFQALDKQK